MKSTNMQHIKAKPSSGQPPRLRPSFTLVELLIVLSIIGIMTGMILFALLGAQTDARVARTRGTIQKLNDIVLQHWEEFRYKPVDIGQLVPPPLRAVPSGATIPPNYRVSAIDNVRLRMIVLRDNMRMEMPDRITDLIYAPSQYTVIYREPPPGSGARVTKIPRAIPPRFAMIYESLRSNIESLKGQAEYAASWSSFNLPELPPGPLAALAVPRFAFDANSDADWNAAVSSSELLYLMVSTMQYSGSTALEHFRSSEVGDPDGDGLLEFVDAWGNPISWIRWPAGYPGDLVRYADNDAMDPMKTDWRVRGTSNEEWHPRTLVPLIMSAGADGDFGVTFDFSRENPIVYATMRWRPTEYFPFPAAGDPHYTAGDYFYPDPFFTWDYRSGMPNGRSSLAPLDDSNPDPEHLAEYQLRGFRANQIGSVPNLAEDGSPNTFAVDNITNHDLILEP